MPFSPLGPVPGLGYAGPVRTHALTRLSDAPPSEDRAAIAEEIPVAFVYNNVPFVVVMASPDHLEDLGAGFSITEGIIDVPADIARMEIVRHSRGIEVQMTVPDAAATRLTDRRRGLTARTGCGVCGIESIDEALRAPPSVTSDIVITKQALWRAAEGLEQEQPLNRETRAVHAAAFADSSGELRVVREDVGRHNALDKVIGALGRGGIDASSGFLIVTSRASYELVQKAAIAGVPLLAAISRPTSLAIQLADQANVTLVGLLRGRSANVYAHARRIHGD